MRQRRLGTKKTTSSRPKTVSSRTTAKSKRMNDYGNNWEAVHKECLRLAGNRCAKCGHTPSYNAHHIIPLSRGGRNVQSNLQCLCDTCHNSKHKHLRNRHLQGRVK